MATVNFSVKSLIMLTPEEVRNIRVLKGGTKSEWGEGSGGVVILIIVRGGGGEIRRHFYPKSKPMDFCEVYNFKYWQFFKLLL